MSKTASGIVGVIGLVGLLTPALATEQIYHPVNPVLGGNPNNGPVLLSSAQSQGEGVKSGNQGPDLSGLDKALAGLGQNNNNNGGTTPPAQQPAATFRSNSVANPLATSSGRF